MNKKASLWKNTYVVKAVTGEKCKNGTVLIISVKSSDSNPEFYLTIFYDKFAPNHLFLLPLPSTHSWLKHFKMLCHLKNSFIYSSNAEG